MGSPCEFRVTEPGLEWRAGRNAGLVRWHSFLRVRMTFRPVSMQMHRFVTELWADDATKLTIVSTSWKSMFEQERLDQSYAAFVTELHRRLAAAGTTARLEQGTHPLRYWPGLVIFAAVSLALAALTVRALQMQAFGGAAFIAAFLMLFLWRGGEYFRRNRPRLYRAEAPPADLIPKA
jgi:hypothetical protein